jgi:hypothetical protein
VPHSPQSPCYSYCTLVSRGNSASRTQRVRWSASRGRRCGRVAGGRRFVKGEFIPDTPKDTQPQAQSGSYPGDPLPSPRRHPTIRNHRTAGPIGCGTGRRRLCGGAAPRCAAPRCAVLQCSAVRSLARTFAAGGCDCADLAVGHVDGLPLVALGRRRGARRVLGDRILGEPREVRHCPKGCSRGTQGVLKGCSRVPNSARMKWPLHIAAHAYCKARHGTVRHGKARHGKARHGKARQGTAR